jgi:hypothetical protein
LLNWGRKRSVRLALAAIVLLVLQSTLVTVAEARGANAIDAFGNPLCISGHVAVGADQPAGGHHNQLPNCCAFGCSACSTALEASGGLPFSGPALSLALVRLRSLHDFLVAAADSQPGSARAPPFGA